MTELRSEPVAVRPTISWQMTVSDGLKVFFKTLTIIYTSKVWLKHIIRTIVCLWQ